MKAIWRQFVSLFQEESKEAIVLESKLCKAFSEIKDLEQKISKKLSANFEDRLRHQLDSISPSPRKVSAVDWVQNPKVQYALSFVLLFALGTITFVRSGNSTNQTQDSAGVVSQSSSIYNTNTSLEVSDSFKKRELIDSLRKNPNSLPSFRDLETYYMETGRNSAAEEIHSLIEASAR